MAKQLGGVNREQYWHDYVVACAASGLSQRAYCQQAGIGFSTLQRWARHFRLSSNVLMTPSPSIKLSDHFMPVSIAGDIVKAAVPCLEVRLQRGDVLRFEGPWPWTEIWPGIAALLK